MNSADDISSMTDSHSELVNYSLQLNFIKGQLFNLQTKCSTQSDIINEDSLQEGGECSGPSPPQEWVSFTLWSRNSIPLTVLLKELSLKVVQVVVVDLLEGVAQVLVLAQEMCEKGKGKEDHHAYKAKSVEDSSTKGGK